MPDINVSYLFDKSPEEIVKYFESKGMRYSFNWRDTWKQAHAKAFTVAKVMRMDILQDIRDEVTASIKNGTSYEEFEKNLKPTLLKKGWWGKMRAGDMPGYKPSMGDPDRMVQLGSPRRLKTIYQTNLNSAYNSGRWNQQWQNRFDRPFLEYRQIQRETKRDEHSILHRKIFHIDDPRVRIIYPPNGFGCGCYMRARTADEIDRRNLIARDEQIDFTPSEGFDYNPGEAAFYPNLDKYDYEVAKQFVAGGLTGPGFKEFFNGNIKGNHPVAVIDENLQKLFNSESKSITLNDESLSANKNVNKKLLLEDYEIIPDLIDGAGLITETDNQIIVYSKNKKQYYKLVINPENNELKLETFSYADNSDLRKAKKKEQILLNNE